MGLTRLQSEIDRALSLPEAMGESGSLPLAAPRGCLRPHFLHPQGRQGQVESFSLGHLSGRLLSLLKIPAIILGPLDNPG